jgi:hypothetical protein
MMVMMFLAMDATNARSKMVGIAQIMKSKIQISQVLTTLIIILPTATIFAVMVYWLMTQCILAMTTIMTMEMDAAPSARLKEVTTVKEVMQLTEITVTKLAVMVSISPQLQVIAMMVDLHQEMVAVSSARLKMDGTVMVVHHQREITAMRFVVMNMIIVNTVVMMETHMTMMDAILVVQLNLVGIVQEAQDQLMLMMSVMTPVTMDTTCQMVFQPLPIVMMETKMKLMVVLQAVL